VHSTTSRTNARFIFISDGVTPSSWQDAAQTPAHRVGWRVIAANNRPLGRSSRAFASYAAALADALVLKRNVAEATSSVLLDQTFGHWTWRLMLNDVLAASCVHEYKRRVECARALGQFLEAIQAASPDAAELRHFGPNALRAYDRRADLRLPRRLSLAARPALR
jgi:hypothetical protein